MKNITKAIIAVIQEVKGIEKNTNVGAGNASYKGVSDKDVKQVIRAAMAKHGLAIVPTSVEATSTVHRWEEDTGRYGVKQKQSVFTEARTKYMLLHESGESIEVEGYGHGVDSQDKSAGKATTYALKYALLYTFLVPTGEIDDADANHSEEQEVPKANAKKVAIKKEAEPTQPALDAIAAAQSRDELTKVWQGLTPAQKKDPEVRALAAERGKLLDTAGPVIE